MTRKLLTLFVLGLTIALGGCSFSFTFVVINKSDHTIEVEYTLKHYIQGKYGYSEAPAKIPVTDFEKTNHEWRKLNQQEYEFDAVSGTFKVLLGPDEVLLVDRVSESSIDSGFRLASIRIEGPDGSVCLEGRQAQTQFKPEGDTNYVLRYR